MNLSESISIKEPPEYLYHYTSISGLYGIVNSRSLWMTDISYLSDKQEFIYSWILLVEAISESESIREDPLLKPYFGRLASLPSIDANVFVFSLSEEADLLSKWRGYCRDGAGYSVGFKSDLLIPFLDKQELLLAPCIYPRLCG